MSLPFVELDRIVHELASELENLAKGVGDKKLAVKLVDDLENEVWNLIAQRHVERITDERFAAASQAIDEVTGLITELKNLIYTGRWVKAKNMLASIHTKVKRTLVIVHLVSAGTPMTALYRSYPEYVRGRSSPESILRRNPLAAEIYDKLVGSKEGFMTFETLAEVLGLDLGSIEDRSKFNEAIDFLVSNKYCTVWVDEKGRRGLKIRRLL